MNDSVTILTAADHKYYRTVWQLLRSFERLRSPEKVRWILYDLGLHDDERTRITTWFPWCEIKTFQFDNYPEHIKLRHASYGWKPILIASELEQASGPLFWFDAGTIMFPAWSQAIERVKKYGFWILRGQTALRIRCDPRVSAALGMPKELLHLPEYPAGAIGLDPQNSTICKLVERWKNDALVKNRIKPDGTTWDHKPEQAVLSCLLYMEGWAGRIDLPIEEIDISSAYPTRLISTRNFVDNKIPVSFDGLMRLWSWLWKFADRQYLKIMPPIEAALGGFRRYLKEYFQVCLQEIQSGRTISIKAPLASYYADPFLLSNGDRFYLFVEEYRYLHDQGRLVVLELDQALRVTKSQPLTYAGIVSDIACHASFPFVFRHAAVDYMVPETCRRMSVDLYSCQHWPRHWQLARRLLFGLDAADTMLIFRDDKWWLITSVREGSEQRHLEIFYSSDLLTGEFLPHPVNGKQLYADRKFGTGRNAGFLAEDTQGRLFRLMQCSEQFYGQGSQLMEIVTLNETEFEEVPAEPMFEGAPHMDFSQSHHFSTNNGWIAFDRRTRAR